MHLAIDAVGIQRGGGAAILREFLAVFPRCCPQWQVSVFVLETFIENIEICGCERVQIVVVSSRMGLVARWLWTVWELPRRLESMRADCLLAFANIGVPFKRFPQVTYVQQALPFIFERYERSIREVVREKLLFLAIRQGLRCSSRIVVQTESMRHLLGAAEPSVRSLVTIIPGGLSESFLQEHATPDWVAVLEGLTTPVVAYVADGFPHKNHAVLFRAISLAKSRGVRCKLAVTLPHPEGPVGISIHVGRLHRMVVELGLTDEIIWCDNLSPGNVRELLCHSAVVAYPSLCESFGLPLLEARAVNVPVLASDRFFAREVADPKTTEYLDPHDVCAWADALVRRLGRAAILPKRSLGKETSFLSYSRIVEQLAQTCDEAVVEWHRAR